MTPPVTLEQLNELNRRFWNNEHQLLEQRMAVGSIRDAALDLLRAEQIKALPSRYQTSLYEALQWADRTGKRFLAEFARKGGKATKTDALQILIEKIVEASATISVRKLEKLLGTYQGIEIIEDIENGTIWFTDRNGQSKQAKLSGLKDRLTRAKKRVQSR